MSEGDFAREGVGAAADDGGGGGAVVRGTERALVDYIGGAGGDGVDFGDNDLFFGGRRREEIHGGAGEKGFSGARRAGNEDVVVAGDGDKHGAFCEALAQNMVQNRAFYACFGIFYNMR